MFYVQWCDFAGCVNVDLLWLRLVLDQIKLATACRASIKKRATLPQFPEAAVTLTPSPILVLYLLLYQIYEYK